MTKNEAENHTELDGHSVDRIPPPGPSSTFNYRTVSGAGNRHYSHQG